jgi:hypothetical protein
MWSSFKRMSVTAAVASTAALAVFSGPAKAADVTFDAGVACSFELQLDFGGGAHRVDRTFVDANGNPVRMLDAGRGSYVTFTNAETGKAIVLPPNGSVLTTVFNADGSQTLTLTGHTVLILFATDVPAGPSTTLFVGRAVIAIDVNGVFTLVSTSGTATDICAAVS